MLRRLGNPILGQVLAATGNSTETAIKNPQPRPREILACGHEISSREV